MAATPTTWKHFLPLLRAPDLREASPAGKAGSEGLQTHKIPKSVPFKRRGAAAPPPESSNNKEASRTAKVVLVTSLSHCQSPWKVLGPDLAPLSVNCHHTGPEHIRSGAALLS